MYFKKISVFLGLLFAAIYANAQQREAVEMASVMRASGKIYVVVAVLVIIFIGIVIYLSRLDKKISKLEIELKDKLK